MRQALGFLGFGNMGGAIARGLVAANTWPASGMIVYDLDAVKRAEAGKLGARVAATPAELAQASDALVLAPKPQDMAVALAAIRPGFSERTLIVSIAAGISISFIQARLGAAARVARVMPNTPAMVGLGAAAISLSANATGADAVVVKTIFDAIGICETVPEESMDAVTGLSGSGPAYFFYMVECLVDAAKAQGLTEAQALRLVGQTLYGAGKLLMESGEGPAILRERVTSKGGTTAAGLAALSEKDFAGAIHAAVAAATARSRELGQ